MWNCSCQKKKQKSQKNSNSFSVAPHIHLKTEPNNANKKINNTSVSNNIQRQEVLPSSKNSINYASHKIKEEVIFIDDKHKQKIEIEEHLASCRIFPLSENERKKVKIFKTDIFREKFNDFM